MLSAKLPGAAPGPRKRYLVALAPDAVRLYALPKGSSPGDPDPDPHPNPGPSPNPNPNPSPSPSPSPERHQAESELERLLDELAIGDHVEELVTRAPAPTRTRT